VESGGNYMGMEVKGKANKSVRRPPPYSVLDAVLGERKEKTRPVQKRGVGGSLQKRWKRRTLNSRC